MTKKKQLFKQLLSCFYILGSFGFLDVWLRVITRWINRYSIYSLEPNLFTLSWAIILSIIVLVPSHKNVRRTVYGVLYYFFLTYAVVQYGAYLILGDFVWLGDFLSTGEGADYADWAMKFISLSFIIQVIVLILIGVIGIIIIGDAGARGRIKSRIVNGAIVVLSFVCIGLTPQLYQMHDIDIGTFNDPSLEYERFSNSNYDMELTGVYQYLAKDVYNTLIDPLFVDSDAEKDIDEFFADKNPVGTNDMTGIFAGKNLIVLQLETVDDWMITEKDMPTTYRLMHEGINFSELYTPGYGSGYTFNTEFAFNTSMYPYSNGNATYSLVRNSFKYSIANVFSEAGYTANSFHAGAETFYNRSEIHKTFGYVKYHSYKDYPAISIPTSDDRFLTQCDELYNEVTSSSPFFSFVITFSSHLPYDDTEELSRHALSNYPEYDLSNDREVNILRAKAKLTDDMLEELLYRLSEDGLLDDTVIVAYGDHYSYGLSDTEKLQQLSETAGSSILERTPAFIYCSELKNPITVDKVVQITDLAPTIMNLFGMDVPHQILGRDIFDDTYSGYAVFPDNTWLTNSTYIKNGIMQWNDGLEEEEVVLMNQYVTDLYRINDAILDVDYYK